MKTRVNIIRIIAYLVQLAIVITAYDFFRNYFMLIVLLVTASFPFFSIAGVFILRHKVNVELNVPEKRVGKDETGYLNIEVKNRSILISYDIRMKLKTENKFYGDSKYIIISMPSHAKGSVIRELPIHYSMLGTYDFSIENITIRDMLGLVNLKKRLNRNVTAEVLPVENVKVDADFLDFSSGMTESEETLKKGHDFSDVSDVREYIPGDKLNSLHWKLTAKRDILMVKDRVSMSDQQMVILTELSGEPEEVDEVLSLSYAVTRYIVMNQTAVRFLWWSVIKERFEEREILNIEQLLDAFSDIYMEHIYKNSEMTRKLMQAIYPERKAYVRIAMKDTEPSADIVEQD